MSGFSDEIFGDDLTDDDLEFLKTWSELGRSETSDAEYKPEGDGKEFESPSADGEPVGEAELSGGEGEEKTPGESGDIDETKMDISDFGAEQESGSSESKNDSEGDHLEDGEGDEIQDGESELDYEPPDFDPENADEGMDFEDEITPEEEDQMSEGPDVPADGENFTDAKVEEDDGEGERGNSDEARESDEPIEHHEDSEEQDEEDEAREIDEAEEAERNEEREERELDEAAEAEQEIKADAAEENYKGDAQEELEDHLKENEEAEPEQKADKTDKPPEPDKSDQPDAFEGMPDAGEACTNHCEDNDDWEDHDGECPHCKGRIKRERELWGAIATDMHGNDILPGDKLRVQIPISFMMMGSILTANVPNQAVDPQRVAEQTNGNIDTTICWLSGRTVSQFTGWHMQGSGNPVWTFPVGKRIGFVEKIGEPAEHGEHGPNAEEGDQLDIEDIIEDLEERAQKAKEVDEEIEASEPEAEKDVDEEEPDDEEEIEDEAEDFKSKLPQHQKARFQNIVGRLQKKIEQTFGGTCEKFEIDNITDHGSYVEVTAKVISRGMTFGFDFVMRKYDSELDGPLDEPEDEAA